jgi:uncharacterized membrane protein (DUF4010 family)
VVTGVLGGIASSTATTLVAARHARDGSETPPQALIVILLANATMLVRVALLVAVVAPPLAAVVAGVLVPALALTAPAVLWSWRAAAGAPDEGEGEYRNPANLSTALGFAAAYAVVLVLAEWARESTGTLGVLVLAAVSGLTDVDAITLSMARLQATGSLSQDGTLAAIALAVAANLLMKTAIVFVAGGREMGIRTAVGFLLPFAALVVGASR